VKRKPSAFNVFVRKTLEQAKKEREDIGEDSQGGPENNGKPCITSPGSRETAFVCTIPFSCVRFFWIGVGAFG